MYSWFFVIVVVMSFEIVSLILSTASELFFLVFLIVSYCVTMDQVATVSEGIVIGRPKTKEKSKLRATTTYHNGPKFWERWERAAR